MIGSILGKPREGSKSLGVVPLESEHARARALRALGSKGCHELYLLAEPPAALPFSLLMTLRGLARERAPAVSHAEFHALVDACRWVLTSHGNVPGLPAVCLYSTSDPWPVVQRHASLLDIEVEQTESPSALNDAFGITPPPLTGPHLSELTPAIREGALDATSTNVTSVDGLPPAVHQLVIDDTAVVDLAPLARTPGISRQYDVAVTARSVRWHRPIPRRGAG